MERSFVRIKVRCRAVLEVSVSVAARQFPRQKCDRRSKHLNTAPVHPARVFNTRIRICASKGDANHDLKNTFYLLGGETTSRETKSHKASQPSGFSSSSTAPRRFTRSRISGPAFPLITSTGMSRVLVEFFKRFSTSIP